MKEIFSFLTDIAANNDRRWFAEHRDRYEAALAAFTAIAADMKRRIAAFDPTVAAVDVKDTLYRFYRDTRFSADKSPYKNHFGTYINARGKKSTHGGYYLHLQPGECGLSVGTYCLPPQVLRAVRMSIVAEPERFRDLLCAPELAALHPQLGINHLKTLPKGFPRDFPYPEYLRPCDYALTVALPDSFFFTADWAGRAAGIFRLMKPFLDFVNDTVDDYI